MQEIKGKQAVLARARLLTEFMWTPLGDVPVYNKQLGLKTALPAGQPVKGMLYSSTEPTDKFVCENISFETFRTIVQNPHSALYTKDLAGHNNSWAYFGIVCNGFVRYCLNIHRRYSTKRWFTIPGIHKVLEAGCYRAEELEICEVLYAYGQGANHVALITDLKKDETGRVLEIEVSEAIRPSCMRRQFSTAEFFEKYKLFSVCRYDLIDEVPMPKEQDVRFFAPDSVPSPILALDCGNKTNYRTNEDVVISAFYQGEMVISCGDEVIETIAAPCSVVRRFPRGYYRVCLAAETVEFCVTELEIFHEVKDGLLHIRAAACDPKSKLLYMEFREGSGKSPGPDGQPAKVFYDSRCAPLSKVEELTAQEKETGVFARPIPGDAVHFKVYFENPYGVWTHTMIKI